VAPKTVNLYEYQMLLKAYKSMFNFESSEDLNIQASDLRTKFNSDMVNFKDEINQPAVS
jgi:hypothetical protein